MDSEPSDMSDDDISGPDSADDSDPEKLESKEKKAKKMDAFLNKSEESIAKKLETGEYTAEEAIVARNRLDLTYRKSYNKLVKEVLGIKSTRKQAASLENKEETWDDSNNLKILTGMTKNLNNKRKSEASDIENNVSEPEMKKAKVSEGLEKLPADGLSPVD